MKHLLAILAASFLLSQTSHALTKKAVRPPVAEATETLAEESAPMAAKLSVGTSSSAVSAAPVAPDTAAGSEGAGSAIAALPAAASGDATVAQPTAAEVAKLPENQIPVLTGSKEAKKAGGEGMTRLFITLGVLVVGLGATLFGLKRYAAKRGPKKTSTKIQVLTQHALGPKKSLAIIQVAGEAILIGVTDQNISMIKTLALIDDEFPEAAPRNFNTALDEFDEEPEARGRQEDDQFAVQGLDQIRDTVSRGLGRKNKNY